MRTAVLGNCFTISLTKIVIASQPVIPPNPSFFNDALAQVGFKIFYKIVLPILGHHPV